MLKKRHTNIKNFPNSLLRLFRRERDSNQIPEQPVIPQEKTTLAQPSEKPLAPRSQGIEKKDQAKEVRELRVEPELAKEAGIKNKEILLPEITRSEVNLLNFPFFALYHKDVHKRTEAEYRTVVQRNDRRLEISWSVSANQKYGYPGPFDKRIFKATEQIISEARPPIQNPIRLGSLYNLARRAGLKQKDGIYPGWAYKQIREALKRIIATSVESRGAFYNKNKEKWLEDMFHLYDRLIFKGEKLDDGEIADTNYLYLGSWYLESLNARYVKPIDYDYYRSLRNPISCRLYELLGVKFYGMGDHQGFIRYKYSTLCQLLPVTRQKYLSDAKAALNPSHEELKRTAFLKDYQWSKPERRQRDWYVTYWPGERVEDERERLKLEKGPEEWEGEDLALESPRESIPEKTITPEDELLWQKVLRSIEEEVSRAGFETYFSGTRLIELDEEVARIGIPAGLTPRQFQRFHGLIQKHLALVLGRKVDLKFEVLREADADLEPI